MRKFIDKLRNNIDNIVKVILFLMAIVILIIVFPREGKFKYEFQKGKPWQHEDLYAPFSFPIQKTTDELQIEQQKVLSQIKPYFDYKSGVYELQKKGLLDDFNRRWVAKHGPDTTGNELRRINLEVTEKLFDSVFRAGIVELDPVIENKPAGLDIIVLRDNIATEETLGDVFTIRQANEFIRNELKIKEKVDVPLLTQVLVDHLAHNLFFDEEKTNFEKQAALSRISTSRGLVQKGELIISRGKIVTNEDYQILLSLKENYETQLGASQSFYYILAGQTILISISILMLALFLLFYRKDIFANNKKILLILLLIVTGVFGASLVVKFNPDYLFFIPIIIVPVVIRAMFDTRLALFVHIVTIIIIGFLAPNSFIYVFQMLIAGIVAIMSVVKLERRSQFFYTSLWVFLTYILISIGLTLIQDGNLAGIKLFTFAKYAINAALILFVYPLIFFLEKMFGIITDVTLMELGNTNNKLLRELSRKAPGTFQHSLQVANLAEEAIYTIGGNALLVRVGAMYHDIGKMDMPMYFIENQRTGVNPHDELTYEESANIIINHVIEGVEMAKKNGLPEEIIDFIRTHHGTRKVDYFYIKQKKDYPTEDVDEETFTYPGPVPFSKETAVLMMSDSVEAASRSLAKPDEESLNDLVDKIITRQLDTGQFTNANITLKDISVVKKILKKKLQNIYHVRITYPEG